MLAFLSCLGIITTISDIRKGIIRNRIILIFLIIATGLDVVYYGFLAREMWLFFLINIGVITIICGILFFTHSLAGGDCKLIPVMAMLYPAGEYLIYKNSLITMFLPICFAFLFGYFYLLGTSFIRICTGKTRVEGKNIKSFLLSYLKSYGIAYAYISLINMALTIFGKYVFTVPYAITFAICFAIAWLSGKNIFFRKIPVIISVVVVDLLLAFVFKIIPISLSPGTYLFTAMLILCQMTIRTSLYETVKTESVKKGMILSTFSSILMQNSVIDNLPAVSTEDLKSRLTEEEAESVRRWGKSKKGSKEIAIVRKIPFAIFIFMGFITYFIVWVILK